MGEMLAELRGVTKAYGPVQVLRDVDFEIRAGEIHALLGGNGAGKSTLMKILAGLVPASAGEIRINGTSLSHPTPAQVQALGLYLVPQEAHIFPHQSVLQNVCIGLPRAAHHYRDRIERHIAELGVSISPDAKAATLEIADRQLVEILRGMIRNARVLVLDEPTSALTPHEVEALFTRMRALRDAGAGLVFISHKLHELRAICDRITVLRDGNTVLAAPLADCPDTRIIAAMSPGASALRDRAAPREIGAQALTLEGVSGEGFEDISLGLRAGEILALTGVVGAGRTELAETLVGLRPLAGGRLEVNGRALPRPSPRRAVDAGLVYLSEDRQQYGLFLEAPLFWNTSSFVTHKLPALLRPGREKARFARYRDSMKIRCQSPEQSAAALSGGNQQKVLLSKCLAAAPRVLILDEPTRGVDVGARGDIYAIIEELAAQGVAVLLISSDFDEVVRLADRIAVMAGGRIAGELPGGSPIGEIARLAFESREPAHA
ncbi:monosaccharide ABC transporter ATP-binding protein, CUT2 family [Limimaricola pyoseonensis]|uniref:Autoinducer 2 import ATP-binding protein LsrA n=2 Tax=Limimaricola pyoseonensis TaxID=521013 RepID=A0A1G7IL83_9RHOB|nr:monosaccharide ABC transporter ATP-binding protein, CUT2 family [Limimaricola pyoseonensis]